MPAQTTSFEVASIKPANPSADGGGMGDLPGGGLKAQNIRLKGLISYAYQVPNHRIVGGPGWMENSGFDVVAKGPKSATKVPEAEVRKRLQSLLADRFKLVVRRETRELPTYDLVVAKHGPKLKAYDGSGPEGHKTSMAMHGGRGMFRAERMSLEHFLPHLTQAVGRPVIDKTGLTGRYDFKLEYAPELGETEDASNPRPSIFTALQEQIGLKLEKSKGPVEVIVIVSAEKPSPN